MKDCCFCEGDYVIIKEDKDETVYVISYIDEDYCYLSGVYYRVCNCVKKGCLIKAKEDVLIKNEEYSEKYFNRLKKINEDVRIRHLAGKILHIDGDKKYLDKCLDLYKEVGLYAYGVSIKEDEVASKIVKYYYEVLPDVIVITGHDLYNEDGYKKIDNYKNSKHYIEAIKEIRKINRDVAIIAGACQSNFEALVASGADFASSPKRINIHTFDPAVIAIKVATTSVSKTVNLEETFKYIENGKNAFGGLETFGKMRLIL